MTQSDRIDRLELTGLHNIPLVNAGDDLAELLVAALHDNGVRLETNDVLVVAQKIVSKAEGRLVSLDQVVPTEEAVRRARETGKDPRLVELILRESVEIIRQSSNLIITENRLGFVMANAGIDQSNVANGTALLLPDDPDDSAACLRDGLKRRCGVRIGVIVADSIGRAWRNGIVGHAIGTAGIPAVVDLRGTMDLYGRTLRVTEVALADEMAAAATLIMGQGGEGIPAVLIRGFGAFDDSTKSNTLVRDKAQDLFR
ncbi:MAG: coenzyme F420-0:L-glutamate ligase [Gammaproteobacteria bacterium]|nr:coenzyme F420-0:L-glutamate ligase [Gammaproteobacteria bacterium]